MMRFRGVFHQRLERRDAADTAHLVLVIVIGVLAFFLIGLALALLRERKKYRAKKARMGTEAAVVQSDMSTTALDVTGVPWDPAAEPAPAGHRNSTMSDVRASGRWETVPPAHHTSLDLQDSGDIKVVGKGVGPVRTSMLRSKGSIGAFAAMHPSIPAPASTRRHSHRRHSSLPHPLRSSMEVSLLGEPLRRASKGPETRGSSVAGSSRVSEDTETTEERQKRQQEARKSLEQFLRAPDHRSRADVTMEERPGLGIRGQSFV